MKRKLWFISIIIVLLLFAGCDTNGPDNTVDDGTGDTTTDGSETDGTPDNTEPLVDTGSLDGKTFCFSGVSGDIAGYWKSGAWTALGDSATDSVARNIYVVNDDIYVAGDYHKNDWDDGSNQCRRGGYWKNGTLTELPAKLESLSSDNNCHKDVFAYDVFVGENVLITAGQTKGVTSTNTIFDLGCGWFSSTLNEWNVSHAFDDENINIMEFNGYSAEVKNYAGETEKCDVIAGCGHYAETTTIHYAIMMPIHPRMSDATTIQAMDPVYLEDAAGNKAPGEAESIVVASATISSYGLYTASDLYAAGTCNNKASLWHLVGSTGETALEQEFTQTITVLDTSVSAAHEVVKTENNLYAGGYITSNGVKVAGYWKNGTWTALGDGKTDSDAVSLEVAGSDILAGGYITTSGVKIAGYWYNGSWTALGDGTNNSYISDSCVSD